MEVKKIKELAGKANLKLDSQDLEFYLQAFSDLEIYLQNLSKTKFPKNSKQMKRVSERKLTLRELFKFAKNKYSPSLLSKKIMKDNALSFSGKLIKIKH